MQGDFSVQGFEIEGLLGVGAAGEVWQARHLATGDPVALKRVRARDAETHDRARRLVQITGELNHRHLLRVRETVARGDQLVLVLDHADGGTLAELLAARETLDPGEVVTTVAPVAEALAAGHGRDLRHGDISPESIVFTSQGLPLLADLGVHALVDTDDGGLGTHGYTDPSAPGAAPSPAGDVYSLAAVCFAALTGGPPAPPRERRPVHELAPGVPPGLAHAVEAGLLGDPSRRPTAAQFAELLYGACQPTPVRFPMGLVLPPTVDAGGEASPGDRDDFLRAVNQPGAGAHGQDQPFPGLAHPAGGDDRPAGGTAGPRGFDDEEEPPRRRGLLVALAVGIPLLLVAVVGVAWATWGTEGQPGPTTTGGTVAPNPEPTTDTTDDPEPGPTTADTGATVPGTGSTVEPPPPGSPEARWWSVLTELDAARARAFAEGDVDILLEEVYTDDAVVLFGEDEAANDRMRLQAFVDSGSRAEDVRYEIQRLQVLTEDDDVVELRVVDQLQPWTLVGPDGEEQPQPGSAAQTRLITLRPDPERGWLIYNIRSGG